MINSITLLGSSSGKNAGDAALLSGIMDSIDEAMGTRLLYEIPTVRPSFIKNSYKNSTKAISMLPWSLSLKMLGLPTFNSIMKTDLSLVFDAVLFDRDLFNPLFNYMSSLYLLLPFSKKRGKRFAFYNVGTGPVKSEWGRKMLRNLSEEASFITVRDQDSYDLLRELGVENPYIYVGADAALNVTGCSSQRAEQILSEVGLSPNGEILALNVNKYIDTWAGHGKPSMGTEKFVEIYSDGVNEFLKRYKIQVLLVGTQHHDTEISEAVIRRIQGASKVGFLSNSKYSHYEIKGAFGLVSLLFGMRLHATILCASTCSPVIGLAISRK